MLSIGLIGCGRISKTHLAAIAQQPDARCVMCCDIIEERARNAASSYGIPSWTCSYEEMLCRKDIDLISICTPSGLHPQQGIMAAFHGKHVLSEKPMAIYSKDAERLISACEQAGVKLFIVFQNRFNPAIQLMRQAYKEGRFGRIYMIVANVFWTRPQSYYDLSSWRGTGMWDGGAFMNQAAHYVDMMQWLGGPIRSVKAHTGTLARKIEAEDTGSATILFESGAIGSINVTMLAYPRNIEGSITILGETGTVKIDGIAMSRIEHWEFAEQRDYDRQVQHYLDDESDSVYGFGHRYYYGAVVKTLSIEGNNSSDNRWSDFIASGVEGKKSLQLVEKIYGRQ